MDILNWLYLAKNKFVRTTLSSTNDLMIFGSNVGFSKRGDKYQNYAMSAEDFTTSITDVVKPYKVYTALLTQSGGDNAEGISGTPLTIGRTYKIDTGGSPSGTWDFTNVGAPNNDIGTYFIATGTTANDWGTNIVLTYNTGAPVVTVLENTIGNITWYYFEQGKSGGTFPTLPDWSKAAVFVGQKDNADIFYYLNSDYDILVGDFVNDNQLNNSPIEIRVYN